MNRKFRVAIEGNIGVGKTTVMKNLATKSECTAFYEPVEEWRNDVSGVNCLDLYYQDTARWSYLFQTKVLTSLVKRAKIPFSTPIALYERSIQSTRHFRSVLLSANQLTLCEDMQLSILEEQMAHPEMDMYIYLQASPAYCWGRIISRGRAEEANLDFKLIEALHVKHEYWCHHEQKSVVVVNAQCQPGEVAEGVLKGLKQLREQPPEGR